MKVRIILILLVLLTKGVSAQKQDYKNQTIEIVGEIKGIEKSQNDISFYTWSLYLTLEIKNDWIKSITANDCKVDVTLLKERSDSSSQGVLEFYRGGLLNKTAVNNFLGKATVGSKVKIIVLKEWLDLYLNETQSMLRMESIEIE